MVTEIVLAVLAVYFAIGIWHVLVTRSRGVVADILFAALWPAYWYADWKAGRL